MNKTKASSQEMVPQLPRPTWGQPFSRKTATKYSIDCSRLKKLAEFCAKVFIQQFKPDTNTNFLSLK